MRSSANIRVRHTVAVGLVLALAAALLAAGAPPNAPAAAQAARLTIAPGYDVIRVDSPAPEVNGRFGGMFHNAGDVDGDGVDDLLVPESVEDGRVHVVSGATGDHVYVVAFPDGPSENSAQFGGMVGRVGDLGSCPGGEPGVLCPNTTIGDADGVPEFVVGAYRADIGDAIDVGRAYVYDGATGALVKRLQMPPGDLASEAARPASTRPFSFGRSVMSPYSDYPTDAPEGVKAGDMDGGGLADIVVGNSSFYEAGPDTNPACDPGPCHGAGRVYLFAGEDIAGTDPAEPHDEPYATVRNPFPASDENLTCVPGSSGCYQGFGHTLVHIGDVGGCGVDPGAGNRCPLDEASADPNGRVNVVISHIRAPHFGTGEVDIPDAGKGWLIDGTNGAILQRYDHPAPQAGDLWAYPIQSDGAIGDVVGSAHPDVLLPSIFHNVDYRNQGRGWVFNGNHTTSAGGIVLGIADDPNPLLEGNFGGPSAAIGDVAGDFRNEILIGNRSNRQDRVTDAHIFSPATGESVYTIEDPDQQAGSAFGTGVASLGDVNDDGHIDFAVGAWRFSSDVLQAGRLYLFQSNTDAPDPDPSPSPDPDPSPSPDPDPSPSPDPDPSPSPDPDPGTTPAASSACPPALVPATGLVDIQGNVHGANIACILWHGITHGDGANTYGPAREVTRDQMATFLARWLERSGVELEQPTDQGFTDIAGNIHAGRINQMAALGVVQGTTASTYAPKEPVRRDQMASFLVRVYEFIDQQALDSQPTAFADISANNVHRENIDKAATAGWAQGTTAETFQPGAAVRRDQMASFLARVLDRAFTDGHLGLPGGV